MNLNEVSVVLRPRTVPELLDLNLRFFREAGGQLFFRLALSLLGPSLAVCLTARWVLSWSWAAVWLLAWVLTYAAMGPFTVAASRVMFGGRTRVTDVLDEYGRRFVPYAATVLLAIIAMALALALSFLVVPPFIVWVRIIHIHEVSLLERALPLRTFSRAANISAGNWASALGLALAMAFTQILAIALGEGLGTIGLVEFVLQLGTPLGSIGAEGGSAFGIAGLLASGPWIASLRFLAYVNRRTADDGWDVQVRCQNLASRYGQTEPR